MTRQLHLSDSSDFQHQAHERLSTLLKEDTYYTPPTYTYHPHIRQRRFETTQPHQNEEKETKLCRHIPSKSK